MAEIMLTQESFETEVLQSEMPVIVDFFATWCGPCKMLAPIVEELSEELEGKYKVCKYDIDQGPRLAMKYGIASVPTVVVFQGGQPVKGAIGFQPKAELKAALGIE